MLWLDHLLFGNGRGLASPYFDQRFYWLVDTSMSRKYGRGRIYSWSGWFGAQLQSFQWTHPKPGEIRTLAGHGFRPFHSERSWLRVRVSWACGDTPHDLDAANVFLRKLQEKLGSATHD